MKGMVFTSLADLVENQHGLSLWQAILDACPLSNHGGYTNGGIYPDEELLCLVTQLQKKLDIPIDILLRYFGEYLFSRLIENREYLTNQYKTPQEFLLAVETVIHRDIEKLYPGTSFPFLRYVYTDKNSITILYQSKRKLCFLAEGLIQGVAQKYQSEISLIHSKCMHRGDEECHLELNFYE